MKERNKAISEESWERFEQTGDVREYLKYTACTSERKLDCKKEIKNEPDGDSYGDCLGNDANR
ncbi:MAG: hypothetical protein PUC65_16925 [Clostridiales bacterium]|nr:hypothetical protein [Clostridiales bacterium]